MLDDKVTWTSDCHYNDYNSFDMNIYKPILTYLQTYLPLTYHLPTTYPPTYLPINFLLPISYNLPASYLPHNLVMI